MLPATKRTFIKAKPANHSTKILSKKQRKKFEKVVDKKKKKLERGELIEKLMSVQVSDNELSKMTSLSSIQTKGLKRQFAEDSWLAKMSEAGTEIEKVIVNPDEGRQHFLLHIQWGFKYRTPQLRIHLNTGHLSGR